MREQIQCGQGHTWDGADSATCPVCAAPPAAADAVTVSVGASGGGASAPDATLDRPTFAPPGFEVLAEVGRGGSGRVYQARQFGADRLVALKVLRAGAHASAEDLGRFRREARAVARVVHPGVVQIYDLGVHDGQPFLCLEWVAGGSLAQLLERGPLPPADAARLAEQLARAVQFAHEQGVVHRDLSPANVFLTPDGTVKVGDFGLARLLDRGSALTQTESVLGTPHYLAPEQATGKSREAGPAADVYGVGAVLYAMLTGRPPFRADSLAETLLQVRSAAPEPPRRLVAKVPAGLEAVCLKCLAKDPAARYPTAAALGDDLGRFLRGERVEAPPTSVPRRFPGAAVGALLAAALLLAALALLWPEREPHRVAETPPAQAVAAPPEPRKDSAPNVAADTGPPVAEPPRATKPEPLVADPPVPLPTRGVGEAMPVVAPEPTANAPLAHQLIRVAPQVVKYCQEQKYRNVGVLKFRVQQGRGQITDRLGTINSTMADRVENAILLALDPNAKPPFGVIDDASSVAAEKLGNPSYLTPEGRSKLFAHKAYPLRWGSKPGPADAFVTGLVVLPGDEPVMTVVLVVIDRNNKMRTFKAFNADLHPNLMAETGRDFLILRSIGGPLREEEEKNPVIPQTVAFQDHLKQQKAEKPIVEAKQAPVELRVFYDGVPVKFDLAPDKTAQIPEPREGQKVHFELLKKDTAPLRYGVVLKVNGENTLFKQRKDPPLCRKWLLDPGHTRTVIHGYQLEGNKRERFRIGSPEESREQEVNYGRDVGLITMTVFVEEKVLPSDLPADEAPVKDLPEGTTKTVLAAVAQGKSVKDPESEAPEDLLKAQFRLKDSAGTAPETKGLILGGAGEALDETFRTGRMVMSATIRYYKP